MISMISKMIALGSFTYTLHVYRRKMPKKVDCFNAASSCMIYGGYPWIFDIWRDYGSERRSHLYAVRDGVNV